MSDPVEHYVADLSAALRGPARAKARMIDEIRDGLAETIAAHSDHGVPHDQAVERALREFGTVDELVPSCQQELTIAQTRVTAAKLVIVVGFLIACGHVVWTVGGWQLPAAAQIMIGIAGTAATLAATALAATGIMTRWMPAPEGLPTLVGWASSTASVAMPFAALALATTSPLDSTWPSIALTAVVAVGSHVVLAASARTCRECARLPAEEPT
ncbi:permease prefix domain 1-containing protein [Saccharopolyspora indica]|uniref:permease prefix domain 1-containing protein n=1 Tax=Saccharopolyspora indica TaxID=1229659 RepID=UPI0022EB8FA2|nr:permease prefix domain 1-containing protein [Saccharopolyspora indica]MDA3645858.1 permease prefix domain 1-containing protein [Saccharopolyspora indica]